MRFQIRILVFFLAATVIALSDARAATNVWTNTVGGAWEDAASWSQSSVPDATDQVRVGSNGSYTVTLGSSAVNTVPNSLTNDTLSIHGFGSGSPTLLLTYTNAATFRVENDVDIGNGTLTFNAPNGVFEISTIHPDGLIFNTTSFGTQGVLNVQAGTFHSGSRMIMASAVGTRSIINVTGGTLVNRGNIRVGNNSLGEINIVGGEAVFGQGIVGYVAGATGRIELVSGRMWLTNTASGTLGIGSGTYDSANHGYGELILHSGNFFSGNNTILAVGSGVAATGGGGVGVMNVYGGDHTNFARIFVASSINSTGTVLLADGNWTGGSTWFIGSGSNAFARLTISNASYKTLNHSSGVMNLGDGNYSAGELNLAGGELLMTNSIGTTAESYVSVGSGSNAVARLNVTGGRMAILNQGGLFIGTGNPAFGATTTNIAGTAEVTLTGGRVELRRVVAAGTGVLSNRAGGLLQFVTADNVSGPASQLVVDGGTLSYKNYGALNVTGAVAKFSVVSGSGLQLDSSTNVNIAGTFTLTRRGRQLQRTFAHGHSPPVEQ